MDNKRDPDDAQAGADATATVAEWPPKDSPAASVGEQLSGLGAISRLENYTIQSELGRGGMGVVYAAYDNQLSRRVAVKTLRDHGNIEYRRRLMDEARVMAQLAHPNVVTVFEIGVADGVAFIVMEYIDGVTLGRWLAEASPSMAETLAVFRDAAEGLIAAHERNLVHRDFKPGNVMRGHDGRVRVMDFGLARSARALNATLEANPSSDDAGATPRTGIAGTPAYMAPEQFRGRPTDTASDQFSFCVALYEALYKERPFFGETKEELWMAVERGEFRDPPRGSDVPDWLRKVLLKGLNADRCERFESMRALIDAFAGSLDFSVSTKQTPVQTPESAIASSVATIVDRLYSRRALRPGSPESLAHTVVIDEAIQFVRRRCIPDVDSVIAGARLEKIIGYGTFGTVWEAYDSVRQRKVAVKVFRLEALGEGQMLHRFGRSIRAMKLLSEPSRRKRHGRSGRVVEFYSADSTGLAFSMELLGGGDLREIARLNWDLEKKIEVMIEVCAALEYSHANGVIHRDIKPANIVLDVRGAPVLTDFDIADIKFATSLSTSVEGGLGTPIFAAPEQLVELEQRADERADVYSLGRLLHFLLLERSPGMALEKEPSIGNLFGEPPALVEVVRRATQHDPRSRFRSASEMRHALETCMSRAVAWKTMLLRANRALVRNWQLAMVAAFVLAGLVTALGYQERERVAAERARATAERERELKLMAEVANSETGEAYAQFSRLSEKVQEASDREIDLTLERNRLMMRLSTWRNALANVELGPADLADLVGKIEVGETELAKVDARLAQLKKELRILSLELDTLNRKRPAVAKGESPVDCTTRSDCKIYGRCTAKLGNCITGSDADCKRSEQCKFHGQCTAKLDRCTATSNADCKMSKGCIELGWCTAKDEICTAASNADCQTSKECRVSGKCAQEDGMCIATSNAGCEASTMCLARGQCSAEDGICIAAP
ncbi:Serine/threonine kinase PKN8 [Enhygromyxa salina]|uniref:Serine/threonine kinase PKN8 n=1 Tax=Enhygromyxa salina TaxID=215803 RepID=A0A0C2A6R0_9BACT|nr:serine/threonine-protein kinase [Enhygromyxa salina]KIG19078.1 Serine/threonine kinase PKN8 [Enhygromyxa salina]